MSRPERLAETVRYLTTPIPDALWEDIAEVRYDMDDPEANRFPGVVLPYLRPAGQ